MKILGCGQIFFEPGAPLEERYAKLLLIVVVVRIWFPKKWLISRNYIVNNIPALTELNGLKKEMKLLLTKDA